MLSKLMEYGLSHRGTRSLTRPFLAPAFFTPHHPHFGELNLNLRDTEGEFRIAAFPKSGNVWIASLLASYFGLGVTPVKGQARVTHVHTPLQSADLFNLKIMRGVVLMRDLRDIIVSLYHFTKTNHFIRFHGPHFVFDRIEDMYTQYFLPYFVNRVQMLESLPDAYVKYGWPVVKYENFYDHPEEELFRLLTVWGCEIDVERIRFAISQNSLEALRQGKGNVTSDVTSAHFRKGGYGNYREEMPAWMITDIEQRFGDYLQRWGYLTEGYAVSAAADKPAQFQVNPKKHKLP